MLIRKWLLALVAAVVLVPPVYAAEAAPEDIDQAIEDARRQLDEAATLLGELYRDQMTDKGSAKRAMLGILLGDTSSDKGVELVGVTPGGGADQAGMQAGDLIVELDGIELGETKSPMRTLSRYMKNIEAGADVDVVYLRDGTSQAARITTQAHDVHMLGMMEKKIEKLSRDMDIELEGIVDMPRIKQEIWSHKASFNQLLAVDGDLAEYFDVDDGVVVIEPPKDSAVKAGDVLLSVAGEDVQDVAGAEELLTGIEADAEVVVQRKGKRKRLNVKAKEFAALGTTTKTKVIRIQEPGDADDEVVVKVEIVDD